MRHFDLIIAGGGAAGLSLACHMAGSALRDRSILIVDQDAKEQNDRTWCFWTDRPTLFDDIVYRTWSQLQIADDQFRRTLDLGEYRYKMIRGIDFYRYARQRVAAHPNIEIMCGRVERIVDGDRDARVVVDGREYTGTWVFDSLFTWAASPARSVRNVGYHTLKQQFQGWEVETTGHLPDARVATFMDFRTRQGQGLRFVYVLPLSTQRMIVEYVQCTPAPARRAVCEDALRTYLIDVLGFDQYRVVNEEHGVSPLTDRPFPRRASSHVMTIGTKGGMIKPSTGYAFMRMQEDSVAIVRSLLEQGHPFQVRAAPRRYRYFDAVLLDILSHHAEWGVPIFSTLFRDMPAERVFRFLDEEATLWENVQMIPTMPVRLLVRAARDLGLVARV